MFYDAHEDGGDKKITDTKRVVSTVQLHKSCDSSLQGLLNNNQNFKQLQITHSSLFTGRGEMDDACRHNLVHRSLGQFRLLPWARCIREPNSLSQKALTAMLAFHGHVRHACSWETRTVPVASHARGFMHPTIYQLSLWPAFQ